VVDMQSVAIMAFRKRLKKRGYVSISIKRKKESQSYIVKAVEPLGRLNVCCEYTVEGMYHAFRF
jgi:hypothetical protein